MADREPYSQEAEQGVLGAMLIRPELVAILSADLLRDDFFFADNRAVFSAIIELQAKNQPIDFLTVADHVGDLYGGASALAYTAELYKNTPSAANASAYARIVRERSMDRKLAEAAQSVHELAYSDLDAMDKISQAQAVVLGIDAESSSPDVMSSLDMVRMHGGEMERREQLDGKMDGLTTGIAALDRKIMGLKPGQLVVVAGRPKMGKTTLAMNIASTNALEKKPVLVCSLEMTDVQLTDRIFSSEGMIPLDSLRGGKALQQFPQEYQDVANLMASATLDITVRAGLSISRIRSIARRKKLQGGLSLLVIDHLGLVAGEGQRENVVQRISEITRQSKLMAIELGCPVILVSQLNRDLEKRPDKRPICSDLRDSGSIEQDADIIMFVYQDCIYNPHTDDRGIAEIIIAAARDFEPGTVRVGYNGGFSKFYDLHDSTKKFAAKPVPHKPYAEPRRGLEF